jgi:hypothetical protein
MIVLVTRLSCEDDHAQPMKTKIHLNRLVLRTTQGKSDSKEQFKRIDTSRLREKGLVRKHWKLES